MRPRCDPAPTPMAHAHPAVALRRSETARMWTLRRLLELYWSGSLLGASFSVTDSSRFHADARNLRHDNPAAIMVRYAEYLLLSVSVGRRPPDRRSSRH